MGRKKLTYLVLDCETATMPFANEVAENDAERKKKIAIAKPLIYDVGWQIIDRQGNVYQKKQFLCAEIFSVPSVFNTAYYKDKRPLYLEMIRRKEISVVPWETIAEEFASDLANVDYVGAFNSMFDFIKAIPFTELYVRKLYSEDYYEWEQNQRFMCKKIANEKYKRDSEKPPKDTETFKFRGVEKPLFDIWGMCCESLLNRDAYRKLCLDLGMISASGDYFKTSAEASFRYLAEKYDFIEAHTALADVEIESFILTKILQRKAVTEGITFFPFRLLGTTTDYLQRGRGLTENHFNMVINIMDDKIDTYLEDVDGEEGNLSRYGKGLKNRLDFLRSLRDEKFYY